MGLEEVFASIAGTNLKAYVLVLDHSVGGRENVQPFLDTRPEEIRNWMSVFEDAIFIISPMEPQALAQMMHTRFPRSSFLISDLTGAKDGWMQKTAWDFINFPRENPQRPGLLSLKEALSPWKPQT